MNFNTCPKCGGVLEYTNHYDKKTWQIIYECYTCGTEFILGYYFIELKRKSK